MFLFTLKMKAERNQGKHRPFFRRVIATILPAEILFIQIFGILRYVIKLIGRHQFRSKRVPTRSKLYIQCGVKEKKPHSALTVG